jgi:hypothetical protein
MLVLGDGSEVAYSLFQISPVHPLSSRDSIKNLRNYKHCTLVGQNKDKTLAAKAVDKPVVNGIIMSWREARAAERNHRQLSTEGNLECKPFAGEVFRGSQASL